MTMPDALDKNLSRLAPGGRRVNSEHWQVPLVNSRSLTVNTIFEDGFLLFDADTGVRPAAAQLVPLMATSTGLPPAVKYAMPGAGSPTLRLRAEVLVNDSRLAPQLRRTLEAMRCASHRLFTASASCATAGGAPGPDLEEDPEPAAGSLVDALKESGWTCHERLGALLVDLEAGGAFVQAEIRRSDGGFCFRAPLYRGEFGSDVVREATCLYLLETNAALRYVRAFLWQDGGDIEAGFEVYLDGEPATEEAEHALCALSVAARRCARELAAVRDCAVAAIYRLARGF